MPPIGFGSTLFVLLWSTGFISAKFGLPYSGPLTYLLYRFALVATLVIVIALAVSARWPQRPITGFAVAGMGLIAAGVLLAKAPDMGTT